MNGQKKYAIKGDSSCLFSLIVKESIFTFGGGNPFEVILLLIETINCKVSINFTGCTLNH